MNYKISNGILEFEVDSMGGEMKSLKANGKEYLWNGDPAYWKRTAPVLFPIVGSLKNKEFIFQNKKYPMGQHGFARDMEFETVFCKEDSVRMILNDTEETRQKYPFSFSLENEYTLKDNKVNVRWIVTNKGNEPMYFSIGGHPAFLCPYPDAPGFIHLYKDNKPIEYFECTHLTDCGTAMDVHKRYDTPGGVLRITTELFKNDALVLENYQADSVSLSGDDQKDYLKVDFEAPLVGIWTPAGKEAPFVCIEPWYGRCDGENFNGTLEERIWGNILEPGEVFDKNFTIEVCK